MSAAPIIYDLRSVKSSQDIEDLKARKKNGIIKFQIGELMKLIDEELLPIRLKHDPIKETNEINYFLNRAHSIIEGFSRTNYTKIRALLRDIAQWSNGFEPIIE